MSLILQREDSKCHSNRKCQATKMFKISRRMHVQGFWGWASSAASGTRFQWSQFLIWLCALCCSHFFFCTHFVFHCILPSRLFLLCFWSFTVSPYRNFWHFFLKVRDFFFNKMDEKLCLKQWQNSSVYSVYLHTVNMGSNFLLTWKC